MNYAEQLKKLEENIRQELYFGKSFSDIGLEVVNEYISLVEKIEGKKIEKFTSETIIKYVYLLNLSEVRNKEFWNNNF